MILAISAGILSFVLSLLGGFAAYKLQNYLRYLIAFCGGTLVAAALINLIPESIELLSTWEVHYLLIVVALSFLFFLILDKLIFIHGHTHSDTCTEHGTGKTKSTLPALGNVLHTFLDGLSIGTGFLVSNETGILIASIVLVHNFADGINTTTLLLRKNAGLKVITPIVFFAAVAPVAGVLCSQILQPSVEVLGVILSVFAGFFLYLGATDLLPEAHKERTSLSAALCTILGFLLVITFSFFH